MNIYKKFGENVKKLRKARGLTQEELADKINRDARTVVAIEGGTRNTTLNTIQKVAQALKVSPSELLK